MPTAVDSIHETIPSPTANSVGWVVDNALRLAEGFASKGFSTVIEGLEDDCNPGSGWTHPTLDRHRTLTVALIPDVAVVVERWKQRTGEETLPRRQRESLAWYRANEGVFDFVAEGFASGLKPTISDLQKNHPEAYKNVLQVAAETCELSQFRDTGVMLHLVGRNLILSYQ